MFGVEVERPIDAAPQLRYRLVGFPSQTEIQGEGWFRRETTILQPTNGRAGWSAAYPQQIRLDHQVNVGLLGRGCGGHADDLE